MDVLEKKNETIGVTSAKHVNQIKNWCLWAISAEAGWQKINSLSTWTFKEITAADAYSGNSLTSNQMVPVKHQNSAIKTK